jgi:imidazolonepropionase-like amidohydrolase
MRVMLMAARAGLDGVSVERLHALADLMLEHGAVLCPTLGVFAATETTSAEDDGETGAAQTEDPNAEVRRMIVAAVELLSNFFVEVLAADGVRMLLGSDSRSAAASIEEARHMRKAGVSEIEVLRAATLYPAEWLGIDDRHGSISPGMAADIVVLHGNPLEDIGNLEAVDAVVQNGVLVSQ